MNETQNVFLCGHNGMVGRSLYKKLIYENYNVTVKDKKDLNLINQSSVNSFFSKNSFDLVIIAAAKVGGIVANNKYRGEFIYDNIMIQSNVIHAAFTSGIRNLLFLGSSCIYPKFSDQPITENLLLTGSLENTNEPYAIAKIAGLKLCEAYNAQYKTDYRSVMPTNLYGPHDNFDDNNSHVIPGLINRMHNAKINNNKTVNVWGTGKALREFLFIEDLADAILHVINLNKENFKKLGSNHINIGYGRDYCIEELAYMIKDIVNYEGDLIFDKTKPDGTPKKLLSSKLIESTGWRPKFDLLTGLQTTYKWYLNNQRITK